ncbi:MAG: iron-containing alcohol dehydrogenase [Candidatus Lokiarchaeota archaeon]|nr:iron-containing alcohol dehydrogenase [Candidatus Lokiarchaeota archaeon]
MKLFIKKVDFFRFIKEKKIKNCMTYESYIILILIQNNYGESCLEKKNLWFFGSPLTCFGQGALDFLQDIPGKKAFIVTDPGIVKLKIIDILAEKLKEFKKNYKVFDQVEPDPREETVIRGAELCKEFKPDLIIGLGGGSSIDAAKAIMFLYEKPELALDELHPFNKFGFIKANLLAIPTTSGTGAETTWAIVITRKVDDGSDFKLELANRELVPHYAIIDPIFTKTLPPNITASTGFDALSHVWEGLISLFKNDFSDGLAIKAIELIRNYLPRAVKDGSDMEAREKMHNAATIAGLSFGNSNIMMGHSIGHSLGAVFHKPHGLTVGVALPYVLQFSMNNPEHKESVITISEVAKMTGIAQWSDDDKTASNKAVVDIKDLMKETNFPTTLEEMGITSEDLEINMELLISKITESISVSQSPRIANLEEYKKILTYMHQGKDIDF